jgi:dephospho-CoA kinase
MGKLGHDEKSVDRGDLVRVLASLGSFVPSPSPLRVVRVTGVPGTGKTTLANRVRKMGIPAIDVDDIVDSVYMAMRKDPLFVDAMKSVTGPLNIASFRDRCEALFRAECTRASDLVVCVGVPVEPIDRYATETVLLRTDLDESYRRLMERETASTCDNRTEIERSIRELPPHMVEHELRHRYKVRVGSSIPLTEYQNWNGFIQSLFPEAKELSADEIVEGLGGGVPPAHRADAI